MGRLVRLQNQEKSSIHKRILTNIRQKEAHSSLQHQQKKISKIPLKILKNLKKSKIPLKIQKIQKFQNLNSKQHFSF